ncbi:UNVERIFIED_CONTAM: E3 ubiquitin-protein ligase COP1 [Sesamum radiatum]|uniref:E3 ubiquitin-protein ligase COP1 n=1 Tax=Sesamum radiatum TaxID=300843 RepID=A0AAW2T1W9_SESRA
MGGGSTSFGAMVPKVKSELVDSSAEAPPSPAITPSRLFQESEKEQKVDKDMLCPICMQIIKDAFLTACGHSFCYMCIVTHLQNKSDCPCCSHFLTANHLYPNFLLNKFNDLQDCYLQKRRYWTRHTLEQQERGSHGYREGYPEGLEDFQSVLSTFTRYSRMRVVAELRHEDVFHSANIVSSLPVLYLKKSFLYCSIEFDRDDELFATAGVSRRIKIFEFSTVVNEPADVHCPTAEMSARSKLSCLSWNRYAKSQIASSDYEGIVTIWDVTTRQPRMFRGHKNEKNFVGLTANSEYIACGSETNEVFVYHKAISKPAARHRFSPDVDETGEDTSSHFISSVCWKSDGSTMVTANSQGTIKVLVLAP